MAKAKTKRTARPQRRRFSEAAWRTDMLARDLYMALVARASKDHATEAAQGVSWEDRCSAAAAEALIAARVFEAIRKATK